MGSGKTPKLHPRGHVLIRHPKSLQVSSIHNEKIPFNTILSLQRTIGNQAVQRLLSGGVQTNIVQRYKEYETDDQRAIDGIWGVRQADKADNVGSLGHNYALDFHNQTNYASSQSNRHAEPKVMLTFLSNRGGKKKLNIISERQPCGDCEQDVKDVEASANPKLEISVAYFIDYEKGETKDELEDFYVKQGKLEKRLGFADLPSSPEVDMTEGEDDPDYKGK